MIGHKYTTTVGHTGSYAFGDHVRRNHGATVVELGIPPPSGVGSVNKMTPDELNVAIAQAVTVQIKPRRKQNSYSRKDWENRRVWRLCTVGKSCKLGAYKSLFNDGKRHEDLMFFRFRSCYCGLAGMFYFSRAARVVEYSYNKKFIRHWANKRVRHYGGEVGNHGFYRKIFDYQWECC